VLWRIPSHLDGQLFLDIGQAGPKYGQIQRRIPSFAEHVFFAVKRVFSTLNARFGTRITIFFANGLWTITDKVHGHRKWSRITF